MRLRVASFVACSPTRWARARRFIACSAAASDRWRIRAVETLPVGFFRRTTGRIDLRNHRKIAVIDGRIGYTGSQNLVDSTFKAGLTYEELNVRLCGPIALELQAVFAEDWYVETGEFLGDEHYFPNPDARRHGSGASVAQRP